MKEKERKKILGERKKERKKVKINECMRKKERKNNK